MQLTKLFDITDSIGCREYIKRSLLGAVVQVVVIQFGLAMYRVLLGFMNSYQAIDKRAALQIIYALLDERLGSALTMLIGIPLSAFAFQRIGRSDGQTILLNYS